MRPAMIVRLICSAQPVRSVAQRQANATWPRFALEVRLTVRQTRTNVSCRGRPVRAAKSVSLSQEYAIVSNNAQCH